LADTISDGITGFLFDEYSAEALEQALRRTLARYAVASAWEAHVRAAMSAAFGWERSVARYREAYGRALARRHPGFQPVVLELPAEVTRRRAPARARAKASLSVG
jgi:glycogen synthase